MANETIYVKGTQKTLMSAGASIANNAIGTATTANYDAVVDGAGFPDAEFVLGVTFTVAPTENSVIVLLAQQLDIDGTNDADVPETTRLGRVIGSFVVNNTTTTQYIPLFARDLPLLATYYLYNNATGQAISANWTLKVTPRSYKAAP